MSTMAAKDQEKVHCGLRTAIIILQIIYSWLEEIANANKGQLYPIYNI